MIPILKGPKVQFQTLEIKSFSAMKEILDRWYLCPVCGIIARGWFYSEKLPIEGDPEPAKVLKREFGLTCKHKFKAEFPEGPISFVPESPLKVAHEDLMFMYLQFETKTKDGIIVQRLLQRSDSYVSNMIAFLSGQIAQTQISSAKNIFEYLSSPNITTTAITTSNGTNAGSSNFGMNASAGGVTNGFAVGTGTTANSPTTGALAAPIGNGTGAGQLSYGGYSLTAGAISGSTTSFTVSRPFTNNSGASITISEVGAFGLQALPAAYQVCLMFRDVLATSVTVANTATTTATYTIGVTTS